MKSTFQSITLLGVLVLSTSLLACKSENGSNESSGTKTAVADGKTVVLKFNLTAGSSYSFTSDMKQEMSTMGMASTNNLSTQYTYKVLAAENGNVNLEMSYDKMTMEMGIGGETRKMSTEDDSEESKPFKSLINKPFTMKVSPEGVILGIEGWEALKQDGNSGMKPEDVKQLMESSINIYPDKPVAVGDSWKKEMKANMQMFKLKIDATYTLKSIEGDVATLSSKGTISMDKVDDKDPAFTNMNMEISGTMSGELKIDVKTGLATSGTLNQDFKGKIVAQGKEMPMTVKSTTQLSGKQN